MEYIEKYVYKYRLLHDPLDYKNYCIPGRQLKSLNQTEPHLARQPQTKTIRALPLFS